MGYLGSHLYPLSIVTANMIEDIRSWGQISDIDNVTLYEEQKPQLIKPLILTDTLSSQEFMNGDIIVVEVRSPQCDISPPEIVSCVQWYEHLNNRVAVSFRSLESIDSTFSLTLDRTMSYETVATFVSEYLQCPPENLRFHRPPICYGQITPISPSLHSTLESMLSKSLHLIYEVLPIPLHEMEKKKSLSFLWRSGTPLEVVSHNTHLSETDTVADLIAQAKSKIRLDDGVQLRVLLVREHSIEYVFHPADSVEQLFQLSSRFVVIEEVPEEEREAQTNLEEFYRFFTKMDRGKRDSSSLDRHSPPYDRKRRKIFREEREIVLSGTDGSADFMLSSNEAKMLDADDGDLPDSRSSASQSPDGDAPANSPSNEEDMDDANIMSELSDTAAGEEGVHYTEDPMKPLLMPVSHYELWQFGPCFHDEPFLFLIHPSDTASSLKQKIRSKLSVTEKEISLWKITLKKRYETKFLELNDGTPFLLPIEFVFLKILTSFFFSFFSQMTFYSIFIYANAILLALNIVAKLPQQNNSQYDSTVFRLHPPTMRQRRKNHLWRNEFATDNPE
jgi:hypothetical protein